MLTLASKSLPPFSTLASAALIEVSINPQTLAPTLAVDVQALPC
jgi:hypothetical protein